MPPLILNLFFIVLSINLFYELHISFLLNYNLKNAFLKLYIYYHFTGHYNLFILFLSYIKFT